MTYFVPRWWVGFFTGFVALGGALVGLGEILSGLGLPQSCDPRAQAWLFIHKQRSQESVPSTPLGSRLPTASEQTGRTAGLKERKSSGHHAQTIEKSLASARAGGAQRWEGLGAPRVGPTPHSF